MISALYWNCHGIGNGSSRRVLRDLCLLHRPSLVCIAKPMVVFTSISSGFSPSLGLQLVGLNDRGGLLSTIWVFACDSFSDAQIVCFHEQQLTVSVTVNSWFHFYTFVYTSASAVVRRSLWQSFQDLVSLVSSSWLVVGDFNAILGAHESLGLRSPAHSSCKDFRFLDHCPLVIRLSDIENVSPRPFRFQSMWLDHPDFMALVHCIWSSSFMGKPPQVVINKLKRLKNALKTWNWEVFGDINSNIIGKLAELQFIQLQMSNLGFSEDLFLAESRVHHKLVVLLRRHESFYHDRSRVKWLKDGDRNSSFFHASIGRRQYMNALSSLSINRVLTDDRLIIREHIIEFYSNLFSSNSSRVETEFSVVEDVIHSLVTDVRTGDQNPTKVNYAGDCAGRDPRNMTRTHGQKTLKNKHT
ncbi:hypothetical protein Dsin_024760 [Dipteronia sinensis]|uniref:Endonuclease/exonuclease/phosphatase domain-containing protein n=1 Tax=Dipteronia sinensis TaxID=43782 RepID=A0AAD9ZUL2_9ROSI|nr:hypothetical protein Dsin_024760 [Dipteronia sinensis]